VHVARPLFDHRLEELMQIDLGARLRHRSFLSMRV
jgi:hypothetical protein